MSNINFLFIKSRQDKTDDLWKYIVYTLKVLFKCLKNIEVSIKDRNELTELYLKFIDERTIYLDPHSDFCHEGICSIIDLETNEILFSDLSPHISKNGLVIMDAFWKKNFNKLLY